MEPLGLTIDILRSLTPLVGKVQTDLDGLFDVEIGYNWG